MTDLAQQINIFSANEYQQEELRENPEQIWDDICRLHTEIHDNTPGEHCVEIRPVMRKPNVKGKHDIPIKQFHLWRADNRSKQQFLKWIEENIKNKGCDLFVSVYCFDAAIKTYKENGELNRPYTINKQNQLYTRFMVIDLDDVSEEENRKFDNAMQSLDVPFQSIQTSPNGFQKRIYLKDQVDDEFALSKFTKLIINKGFNADPKVINRGQVIRLLGSINNKVFSPKFPNRKSQFRVSLVKDTLETIGFKELWEKVSSLKNCENPKYKEVLILDVEKVTHISKENFKHIAYYEEDIFNENYKNIIPTHYFSSLQKPIKYMLIDTQAGYTDAVIMFIIPYFKNSLKLSYEQVEPIMCKWAELNNYTEKDKYERIYYTEYKKGFGAYTSELRERYGTINFKKNYDIVFKINENTTNLNPVIFDENIYPSVDKTALKIFVGFLFEYKASAKITWSIKEIMEFNSISKPTAIKALKHLVEKEFIACLENFKKKEKGNEYTLTRKYIALKTERRLEFTLTQLREMNNFLKGNEIKLFIYMRFVIMKHLDGTYYGNQLDIAKAVGMSQQTVSDVLKGLNKKRFINIEKVQINNVTESNVYTLLV